MLDGAGASTALDVIDERNKDQLLNKNTKVLIQGMTGRIGSFHAQEMVDYGTNLVAGVTPGKGGTKHLDRPIFNTVKRCSK